MTEQITRIETLTPPLCGRCRGARFVSWNPKIGPPPSLARAAFYVLARGTTGLYRHLCAPCQADTQDRIVARFVAPEGEDR